MTVVREAATFSSITSSSATSAQPSASAWDGSFPLTSRDAVLSLSTRTAKASSSTPAVGFDDEPAALFPLPPISFLYFIDTPVKSTPVTPVESTPVATVDRIFCSAGLSRFLPPYAYRRPLEVTMSHLFSESENSLEQQTKPAAFFASRMDLPIREKVFRIGERTGREIWVSPFSAPELTGRFDEETQILCLKKVREAQEFICVLDGSYGTPWSQTQVSFLELELFTAALAGKRMRIFLMEPFKEDPHLSSLLRAITLACPDAKYDILKPQQAIEDEIERSLDGSSRRAHRKDKYWSRILGRLVQYLAEMRTWLFKQNNPLLDVRFLNNEFAALTDKPPDKDFITGLIERTDSISNMPYKLANLWAAIRHLGAVPYTRAGYKEFLPLWGMVLSRWASASAWYGLHGHIFLGRLAACNTLIDIRHTDQYRASFLQSASPISIGGGDLASEYYSIARLAASRPYKRALYNKALWNVEKALLEPHPDPSGLLNIRASVLLSLGRVRDAVTAYEEVHRIRVDAGEGPSRVGEAEADLGMAHFRLGHIRRAERLLEGGVSKLESSDRVTFTVRAMKKLAWFYTLTMRHRRALTVLERAYKLAEEQELYDQIKQLDSIRRFIFKRNRKK